MRPAIVNKPCFYMGISLFSACLMFSDVVGNTGLEGNGIPSISERTRLINEAVANGTMREFIPSEALAKTTPAAPSSYDRSLDKAFPPVRSQQGGSCGSWASVYYSGTYVIAKREGWNAAAGDSNHCLSPYWAYDFVNGGADKGSFEAQCNNILIKHGAATLTDFPCGNPNWAVSWSLDPAVWRRAINYRFDNQFVLRSVNTPAGLAMLKQYIMNDLYATSYATNSPTTGANWVFVKILDDPSTTADDSLVGQNACRYVKRLTGGTHSMAVMGWNDDIWVDVNQNGRIDAGEKGALKVAESHGINYVNSNKGFYWLACDALNPVSKIAGGPTGRDPAFIDTEVICCVAKPSSYSPKLLAEFTLQSAARGQVQLRFLRTDITAVKPFSSPKAVFQGYVFGLWGGQPGNMLGFDGVDYSANPGGAPNGTFVFDLTDIYPTPAALSTKWRYVMQATDLASGLPLTIKSFRIIDPLNNDASVAATNTPVTVDLATEYLWADYLVPPITSVVGAKTRERKSVTIEAGSGAMIIVNVVTAAAGDMRLSIMDLSGRVRGIHTINQVKSGTHRVCLDECLLPGSSRSNGTYVLSVEYGRERTMKRIVVTRF